MVLSFKVLCPAAGAAVLLSSPAAAQISPEISPCPVVKIVPAPADDMTQRLNDNEDCLWRMVQKLDRDVADLRNRMEVQNTAKDRLTQALRDQSAAADANLNASVQRIEREIAVLGKGLEAETDDRKAAVEAKGQDARDAPSPDAVQNLERKMEELQNKADAQSSLIAQLQAQIRDVKRQPVSDDGKRRQAGMKQGGVEIVPESAFVSSSGAQMNASLKVTNISGRPLLLMIIMPESTFILNDAATQPNIRSNGITYCQNYTRFCTSADDNQWTSIQPNQELPLQLSSTLNFHTQAKDVGLKLRIVIKDVNDRIPHDFSFRGIEINARD